MSTTRILSLGTRPDSTTWEKGCRGIGISSTSPIKKPAPSMAEITGFFASSPHWIFIAGHFVGRAGQLYNDKRSVTIDFHDDRVEVTTAAGGQTTTKKLVKEKGFSLHRNVQVVLWGGCNIVPQIKTMRRLFGNNHLLLGFKDSTGSSVVNAALGGGFIKQKKNHFFGRLNASTRTDLATVRDAWMKTALYGWRGTALGERFRAVDPSGQEWKIVGKSIVRGTKY